MRTRLTMLLLLVALSAFVEASAQELGSSWKDRGMQALGTGDLDSARSYYERWLEADPQDELSWYNLACICALQGDRDKALTAWENSVEAGWDDPDHPMSDGDLESIRDDARFTAALQRVSEAKESDGPEGYIRNFLELTSVGTYIVALPPDYDRTNRSYPLCVILHGSGSSETGHGRLADRFGRDDVIYIAPRAPYPHTSSYKGSGNLGFTAWPPERIDSLDPLDKEVPYMYSNWIMQCVRDARDRYRISDDKALLLGHSQGAAFSFITASLFPEEFRSIYVYAGYFPDEFQTEERIAELKRNNVRIRLAHGTADNVVDPEETRMIGAKLQEMGLDCSVSLYDDVTHSILPPVMEDMTEWVTRETGRPGSSE